MTVDDPGFWLAVLQIIWIDLLLSGDNAVVIALACRKLPARQRVWGIALGTLVAIALRVVFTGLVTTLMTMPFVKLIGGLLLIWIAIKLLAGEIILKDPLFMGNLDPATAHTVGLAGATFGAVFVVGVGLLRRRWRGAPDQA